VDGRTNGATLKFQKSKMAVYTHCCRAQPLRQLGFLVVNWNNFSYFNLSRSGTTPVVKERLNIYVSGPTMTSETFLSILELMLSFPGALLLGILCIIRAISSGVTGQQNILFVQGLGQWGSIF